MKSQDIILTYSVKGVDKIEKELKKIEAAINRINSLEIKINISDGQPQKKRWYQFWK